MPKTILIFLSALFLLSACGEKEELYILEVSNNLDIERTESLQVPKSEFGKILCEHFSRFAVRDTRIDEMLPAQFIDEDMDGVLDYMVFQPSLGPGETAEFEVFPLPEGFGVEQPENRTFSRFVPERIDDFAWENDRVAFRTYGPEAQRMTEENVPGGIISSGVDCWLKRVDYPIIDKWYKQDLEEGISYHVDQGEGLDDFHVGPSRGCGGTGYWNADEQKLYTSKNFTDWHIVEEGPLRTLFELDYASWEYPGGSIIEKKLISLDMGSNLMRVELKFAPEGSPESISAGITLHEKDGSILVDEAGGVFSYWQPHGDSELGMGIIADKKYISGYTELMVEEKDQSHLLVHLKPIENTVVYYSGFAWLNSGQFPNQKEWVSYLAEYRRKLESPLEYSLTD